ncbi:unnamed protein product [Owenia fusiformis]|uniref:Uncharacterized protein n=2 Tax=Owenia fusiformis TaxID=6347 RepID=A0A8J1UVP8_OWEFU|nr:unnamed protein product [Owenia fusiformis]
MKSEIEKAVVEVSEKTDKRLNEIETENKKLKDDIKAVNVKLQELTIAMNDTAQQTRKSSVRVFGIPENNSENREDCAEVVYEHLKTKIQNFSPGDIEVAHRVPGGKPQISNRSKPRPILVKFKFRGVKDVVIRQKKALKGSDLRVYEDLTPANRKLLYELKQHDGISQAWTVNGKVLGKLARNDSIVQYTVGDLPLGPNL